MADDQIVTNIVANADFSNLIGDLNKVTVALSRLQSELKSTERGLANQIRAANTQFGDTLRSTGQFTSHFVTISSDVDKFGKSLDSGRMKLGQYFKVWQEHHRTAGGLIRDLSRQQVQMQNAILQPLGKNAEGMMRFAVHVPKGLDVIKNKTALVRQEMAILNKVVQDGAGQLINWGKNTQWAGRQLTVGLTVPLAAFGKAAADAFRQADEELVRLTKVYGDLSTQSSATLANVRKDVIATARELSSSMGVSFKDTIGLAADIAATGKTGNELLQSVKETTRLAVLGEVDRQEAMKATLAIQTAFKQNSDQLAESINFLNAVENQTSTTLNDLVEAIPRAGTVIKGMGGSVQDLALYLTAMREGGVSAAEGANALKSALASLINPTDVAIKKFQGFGIDLQGIVTENAGNLTGTILKLQSALDQLDPLSKQQAIEQLFGKFQFARLNALFENLGKQGSQTVKVLELMKASSADLANIAGRELAQVTESASGKYRRAIETLRADLAKTGEQFLGIATKVVNVVDKVVTMLNNLPEPIKKLLGLAGGFTALVGPLVMLTGVLGNFFGYIVKGIYHFKSLFKGAEGWKLLTPEIMAANNAGSLIEKTFYSDAKAAEVLRKAVLDLTSQYAALAKAAGEAAIGTGSVSTVAGNTVVTNVARQVDPTHPLAGAEGTRSYAHMTPRKIDQPHSIFGVNPSSGPVNALIRANPMIYAEGDLPNIPGLTTISGNVTMPDKTVVPLSTSVGVVANEAAKHQALVAALAMQSKEELAILESVMQNTGNASKEFIGTFDDILPITTSLAQKAARESAQIVAEVQAGKISIAEARAQIIQLNIAIEKEMIGTLGTYASQRGLPFDPYKVPMLDQPATTATGQTNMREMFKKPGPRGLISRLADVFRVRTSGAGYNIETTRPRKFATGGQVPYTLSDGLIVPGPASDRTDTQFGMLPADTYIVNKDATANNIDFLSSMVGGIPGKVDGGQLQPVMLTPGEIAVPPNIVNQGNNLNLLEDINSGRIVMRRTGGSIPRFVTGGKTWDARQFAHLDEGTTTADLSSKDKEKLANMFGVKVSDLDNPRTAIKSGFYAEYHKFFNQLSNRGTLPIDTAIDYLSGKFIPVDTDGNYNNKGKKRVVHDPMIAYAGLMEDLGVPADKRAKFASDLDKQIIEFLNKEKTSGKSILADRIAGQNKDLKVKASILGEAVSAVAEREGFGKELRKIKKPAEIRIPQAKPADGEKRTRGVSTNRFFKLIEDRVTAAKAAKQAQRRQPKLSGLAKIRLARNTGGIIPGFQGGGRFSFLGMPRGIKSVLRDRLLARNIDARVRSGQFKDMEPTDYGHLLQETSGHSFPIAGIGGVYRKPNGEMVFVKPVLDEKAALAEMRATTIAREAHGLNAPRQQIRVMRDPTDTTGNRRLLVLESPYDKSFVGGGNKFTRKQYFSQLVAALLRGDKDLSSSNVFGGTVADVGAAGVFGRASGKRDFEFKMPGMSDFAQTVLLGRKGGARKDFAYNTASLIKNMSPQAYHRAMIDEIDRVLPKLKETIKSFNLNSVEKAVYQKMINRLEEGRNADWTKAYETHKAVKPVASKNLGGSIRGYQGGGKVVGGVQYKNLGGVLRAIWTTIRGALSGRAAAPAAPVIPTAGVRVIPFQAPGEGIPPVAPAVTAAETVGKDISPFGFKGQAIGMAGSVAGTVIGGSIGGNLGALVGSQVGGMAMFLPQLLRAKGLAMGLSQIFSKLFIPAAIVSTLFIIGKSLLDLKKKMEDYGKAQRLAFGGTKESFASVGIKNYTTLSDRLKNINDQMELHRATVKSVYESYTKTGVTGLSLTIKELAEAIKKAKTEQKDFVKAFDLMSAAEVNQKAAMFKAQFIAMGMSAQEATNKIYAIIKASNKASQAFNAITSKDFTSMQTSLDGIKFVVDYLSKTLNKAFDKGTAEEFSAGLDTLLNAVIAYRDSLIGVKDDQGNIRDEADATAETLDKISKIQGAQGKLTADQLDKLKSSNIVYAGILSSAETLESVTAKILLYTGGLAEVVNLSAMSADAAIALAKDFSTIQNIMNSVTEDINTQDKFRNSLEPLAVEIDRVSEEAAKAETAVKNLKKVDEQYYKDKMAAIDDLIKKLEKEKAARLKLIDLQERASTFENQLKSAQIKYQQALTAGNLSQAAQEQLSIQQLSADRQRQLTRDAVNDKYDKQIEKLQADKDALQKELDAANKNYNAKTAAASQKTAELARLKAYRDELEMIALRNINKPISSTDSMRITNIMQEMIDSGSKTLADAAKQMMASNQPDKGFRGQPIGSFSQTLVNNLNADLKSRAAENKDFASAVSRFVAAVDKFAGGTSAPFRDPTKSEKNEKGWLKATASALGISGDTPFDTSIMVIQNPKTNAMYYLPLDSPRFKDAYKDIVAKGYNFMGWQKTLPDSYSKDQVFLDPNKLPKAAYGRYFPGYGDGSTDGPVVGPGTPTSDSIIARLSNGEYVTRASSVSDAGVDNMHLINQKGSQGIVEAAVKILGGKAIGGLIPGFANGGNVLDFIVNLFNRNRVFYHGSANPNLKPGDILRSGRPGGASATSKYDIASDYAQGRSRLGLKGMSPTVYSVKNEGNLQNRLNSKSNVLKDLISGEVRSNKFVVQGKVYPGVGIGGGGFGNLFDFKMYSMGGEAVGGYIQKFHTLRGAVPGPYGQEVGAVLRAKTESVYPTDYINSLKNDTMGGNTYILKNEINAAEGMDINQLADVVTKRTVDTLKGIEKLSVKSVGPNRKFGGNLAV